MRNKKSPVFMQSEPEIQISGSFITEFPDDKLWEHPDFNINDLPILPLREEVVLPKLPQPVKLDSGDNLTIAEQAFKENGYVVAALVRDNISYPSKIKDFYPIGVIGKIIKIINIPSTIPVAFILPGPVVKLKRIVRKLPCLCCSSEILPPLHLQEDEETNILRKEIQSLFASILNFIPDQESAQLHQTLEEFKDNPEREIYFMISNSPLRAEEKAELLGPSSLKDLLEKFLILLNKGAQRLRIQADIQMRTHEDLSRQQREEFLKHQMRTIQNELSGESESDDISELKERATSKPWNKEAKAHFEKELKKLERINSNSPDYNVQYAYLDTLLNLPWQKYSPDNFTLTKVEKILNHDHYGLDTVKERIIEQMAVLKLRNDMKAPILCLYGPPGVGKTSLGKSIASALGREYARISLGGLHDEAEIRGHRRTYIGAMPGRILAALGKCGTGNPVFVLDEIDKMGKDFKGDPSTALLEVLDPEQNSRFHDNYIDFDYDLSKILFIATANSLSELSRPLLDRMEVIEISGYIPEEKIEIAKRHLVPKNLLEHGFNEKEVTFSADALKCIIESYTRESGVRQLEKKIAAVLRKVARLKASEKEFPTHISRKDIKTFLGKELVAPESYEDNRFAGVVTGMAWTQTGGEILYIETSLAPGNGEKLTLTGNLGDVMKESAAIALQYLKAHSGLLGIDPEVFTKYNVHIHVPEGAIPKDGPSAGITMATSLASAFLGRKVREKVAMTGELTLRGKVLPVGGIKEKILAAKRAGIETIILCNENRKDIEEIHERYLTGLTFHYVDTVDEVLQFALLPEQAENRYF